MNSKEKLKIVRKFKEDKLVDDVIIPLLEHMEFKDVVKVISLDKSFASPLTHL